MNGKIKNEVVIYAFAHCEAWLEAYARSTQVSAHELTERVAELLHSQTSGTLLGTLDSVPSVPGTRRKTTQGSKAARPLALAQRPHGKAQVKKGKRILSASARRKIGVAQRKRWAEYHASQSDEDHLD